MTAIDESANLALLAAKDIKIYTFFSFVSCSSIHSSEDYLILSLSLFCALKNNEQQTNLD